MKPNYLTLPLPDSWLTEMGARIQSAREAKGLSRVKLAEAIGMGKSSVLNWENGVYEPSAGTVLLIADVLDRDAKWILTGHGQEDNVLANVNPASPPVSERRPVLPKEFAETFTLTIYTHVEASAGGGLFGTEPLVGDSIEVERVKRLFAELLGFWPPDDMCGVRVRGVSMNRAFGGIIDGQIVLYRPVSSAAEVEDGARYVLTVSEGEDSRVLVKRVQLLMGGGLRLSADNVVSGVSDEVLVPPDPEAIASGADWLVNRETGQPVHLQILGRVIWPTETVDLATAEVVAQTLEALVARGYLPSHAA